MSNRSRSNTERNVKKVRKIRTFVIFALIAVAIAIFVIDKKEDNKMIDMRQTASAINSPGIIETEHTSANVVDNRPILQNTPVTIGQVLTPIQPLNEKIQNDADANMLLAKTEKKPSYGSLPLTNEKKSGDIKSKIETTEKGKFVAETKKEKSEKKSSEKLVNDGKKKKSKKNKIEKKEIEETEDKDVVLLHKESVGNLGKFYVVQEGESLSQIAKNLGVKFTSIYDMNKNRVRNPDRLKTGEKILVPTHSPMASGR